MPLLPRSTARRPLGSPPLSLTSKMRILLSTSRPALLFFLTTACLIIFASHRRNNSAYSTFSEEELLDQFGSVAADAPRTSSPSLSSYTRRATGDLLGAIVQSASYLKKKTQKTTTAAPSDSEDDSDAWNVAEADLGERRAPSELWRRTERRRDAEDAKQRYAKWYNRKGSLIFVKGRGWVPRSSLPKDQLERLEMAEKREVEAKRLAAKLSKSSDEQDVASHVFKAELKASRREEREMKQRQRDEQVRNQYRAAGGID
ncbi:hypothetical protein NFJ02_06g127000 [Pycnococcus provasolii]